MTISALSMEMPCSTVIHARGAPFAISNTTGWKLHLIQRDVDQVQDAYRDFPDKIPARRTRNAGGQITIAPRVGSAAPACRSSERTNQSR